MTRRTLIGWLFGLTLWWPWAAAASPFSAHDLVSVERLSGLSLSADGRRLAYTLTRTLLAENRRQPEIWVMDLTTGRRQRWSGAGFASQWSGAELFYLSRRSGSQQVWRQSSPSAIPMAVTRLPVGVDHFAVSPKGHSIALHLSLALDCDDLLACDAHPVSSVGQAASHDQLFVRRGDRWADGRRGAVLCGEISHQPLASLARIDRVGEGRQRPNAENWQVSFVGEDQLMFVGFADDARRPWSTNQDVWLADCDGTSEPLLLTEDNPAADAHPRVSADARYLYWLAQTRPGAESDRWRLLQRDLHTGKTRELAASWDRSPQTVTLSPDGQRLYVIADDQGRRKLFEIEIASDRVRTLTHDGAVDEVVARGGTIVVALSRTDRAGQLYRITEDGPQALRDSILPQRKFSEPEWFWFKGADGTKVQGRVGGSLRSF